MAREIDINDIAFIALSIETNSKLWTGDKILYNGLKSRGFGNVINTNEMTEIFNNFMLK